jgi:hypothetical protein
MASMTSRAEATVVHYGEGVRATSCFTYRESTAPVAIVGKDARVDELIGGGSPIIAALGVKRASEMRKKDNPTYWDRII